MDPDGDVNMGGMGNEYFLSPREENDNGPPPSKKRVIRMENSGNSNEGASSSVNSSPAVNKVASLDVYNNISCSNFQDALIFPAGPKHEDLFSDSLENDKSLINNMGDQLIDNDFIEPSSPNEYLPAKRGNHSFSNSSINKHSSLKAAHPSSLLLLTPSPQTQKLSFKAMAMQSQQHAASYGLRDPTKNILAKLIEVDEKGNSLKEHNLLECHVDHGGEYFIGRSPAANNNYNDIQQVVTKSKVQLAVLDARVSAKHVSIRVDPITKQFFITDISSNGTYLNDNQLVKGSEKQLRSGDRIQLILPNNEEGRSKMMKSGCLLTNKNVIIDFLQIIILLS